MSKPINSYQIFVHHMEYSTQQVMRSIARLRFLVESFGIPIKAIPLSTKWALDQRLMMVVAKDGHR